MPSRSNGGPPMITLEELRFHSSVELRLITRSDVLSPDGVAGVKRKPLSLFLIPHFNDRLLGWDHQTDQAFVAFGTAELEIYEEVTIYRQSDDDPSPRDGPVLSSEPDPDPEADPPSTERSTSDNRDVPPEEDTSSP